MVGEFLVSASRYIIGRRFECLELGREPLSIVKGIRFAHRPTPTQQVMPEKPSHGVG